MKTLKVSYDVPSTAATSARVETYDGGPVWELALVNGSATLPLSPGKYVLRWRAYGARPGEEYTIKITAPTEAAWKPDTPKKVPPSGRVTGRRTFTITA